MRRRLRTEELRARSQEKKLPKTLEDAAADPGKWQWQIEDFLDAAQTLLTRDDVPVIESLRRRLGRMTKVRQIRMLRGRLNRIAEAARRKEQDALRKKWAAEHEKKAKPENHSGGWTLRLEKVKCGKKGCDKLHGPYWYGARFVGGRTVKRYFGKKRPTEAELVAASLRQGKRTSPASPLPKKGVRRGMVPR